MRLLHVLVDYFGQLEHGDLVFAKQRPELAVSIDHSAVLFVLQVVLLNIIPDLLYDLCSWHGLAAYYFS